jgi:hypothetical protein
MRARTIDGTVLGNMLRICAYRSTPTIAAVKFVVSDSGEILSPNHAPETTAPAVYCIGIPMPSPIPSKARPSVPTVPQDVPVATETIAQMMQVTGRNIAGERNVRPKTVRKGTVPLNIHVLMVIPTVNMMPRTGIEIATFDTIPPCISAQLNLCTSPNTEVIKMPSINGMWGPPPPTKMWYIRIDIVRTIGIEAARADGSR